MDIHIIYVSITLFLLDVGCFVIVPLIDSFSLPSILCCIMTLVIGSMLQ